VAVAHSKAGLLWNPQLGCGWTEKMIWGPKGDMDGYQLTGSALVSITGGLSWAVTGRGARALDGLRASPRENDGAPCACTRDAWFGGGCPR
jgi:hypothetical protein